MTINAELVQRENLSKSIFRLTFATGRSLNVNPGQRIEIDIDGVWRSYSIAELLEKNKFAILVKMVDGGVASRVFQSMSQGAEINFKVSREAVNGSMTGSTVCICLGTGIVPLYAIVEDNLKKGFNDEVIFLYAANDERDLVYVDKLNYLLRRYANVSVKTLSSINSRTETKKAFKVETILYSYVVEHLGKHFYISARDVTASRVRQKLVRMGVLPENISII